MSGNPNFNFELSAPQIPDTPLVQQITEDAIQLAVKDAEAVSRGLHIKEEIGRQLPPLLAAATFLGGLGVAQVLAEQTSPTRYAILAATLACSKLVHKAGYAKIDRYWARRKQPAQDQICDLQAVQGLLFDNSDS